MAAPSEDTGYLMASDEEISRLSNQHDVIKDAMGGLVLAPIDLSAKPFRILDSATADGTWIRDLQCSLPTTPAHTFVGIDIDPSKFPLDPPTGTSYHIQDINKPWPEDWKQSFDFVHQRLTLVGAGPNGQAALKNLSELVKPGGWIQLIEAENVLGDNDGPAMHDFVQVMKDIFVFVGAGVDISRKMVDWLKADGFVDIEERLVVCQMGATNPNPQLAKQGVYSTGVAATGLVGFAKSLPPETQTLPAARLDGLVANLREELSTLGGGFPLRVAWGRKPL